jgi:RNA polymerase sigma-70 factor (ECF subfamily)
MCKPGRRKDIDGLVALLREDAVLSMPPWPNWYRGRDAIRTFFAWAWPSRRESGLRIVAVGANRQPAFVYYLRDPDSSVFVAHGIQILTLRDDAVAAITVFRDAGLLSRFGVPATVPGQ